MSGKKAFITLKEAEKRGFYDEYPMLPADEVDMQLCLSRNDRPQPFYLICEKDTVLVQFSGKATVEFKKSSVLHFKLDPGDYVYVPAGTPHRIVPQTESIQYRYKAINPGHEGVAWYCQGCSTEISRLEWNAEAELSQAKFLEATTAFNASEAARTCSVCGSVHEQVDISGNYWQAIVDELRADL